MGPLWILRKVINSLYKTSSSRSMDKVFFPCQVSSNELRYEIIHLKSHEEQVPCPRSQVPGMLVSIWNLTCSTSVQLELFIKHWTYSVLTTIQSSFQSWVTFMNWNQENFLQQWAMMDVRSCQCPCNFPLLSRAK